MTSTDTPVPGQTATITQNFRIDGMSCKGCVASVLVALNKVPGVHSVSVDLANALAEVEYEEQPQSRVNMKSAVENLGYRFYEHK